MNPRSETALTDKSMFKAAMLMAFGLTAFCVVKAVTKAVRSVNKKYYRT